MKLSHSRHFTVEWYRLTICGSLRIRPSAISGVPSDEPLKQGDGAGQSENDHGQIEHRPPPVSAAGLIVSWPGIVDNCPAITVTSQRRLAPTDYEQLCDCDPEPDAEYHEPELHHAPTT